MWIRETGTRGLRPGPQHPPAQGAPRPNSNVRIMLAWGRLSSVVTPESAGAGDVVFKLSLRRKKSTGTTKRGVPGPAPVSPVSLKCSKGLAPRGQPAPQASSVAEEDSARDPGCGDEGGGGPTEHVPVGVRRRVPALRKEAVRRTRSDEPQWSCCPSMWAARDVGALVPTQHISHRWAVGASRWAEARMEKGAVLGSHSLCWARATG